MPLDAQKRIVNLGGFVRIHLENSREIAPKSHCICKSELFEIAQVVQKTTRLLIC